jgi:hypothetical protein
MGPADLMRPVSKISEFPVDGVDSAADRSTLLSE